MGFRPVLTIVKFYCLAKISYSLSKRVIEIPYAQTS